MRKQVSRHPRNQATLRAQRIKTISSHLNLKSRRKVLKNIDRSLCYRTTEEYEKLTLSAPTSLSVCKFSLHYPHKIGCLRMRIKQMIIHSNLYKMKNKIPPTCLQRNYRDRLGEFSNMPCGAFGQRSLKPTLKKLI